MSVMTIWATVKMPRKRPQTHNLEDYENTYRYQKQVSIEFLKPLTNSVVGQICRGPSSTFETHRYP